ncbi:MAG: outer membrane beta-barrel domain-containing protein [Halobacteriovoraceae bacterium]|nr:outer membrane beta-barrel domain-containing protein [Halobacteriovoraceae bacterium]MCB9095768.1 outer membrane beta-barrel domain-containing protein [Halobacteriovoraceae bacterium]
MSVKTFAGTADIYEFKWLDPKKKVFVLQNKLHENRKTWYFNLGYGISELSDFQDSRSIYASTGYFFSEEWGLELFYSKYSNENNDSYDAIRKDLTEIPHIVRLNAIYGLNLLFSPFYGKINTFNLIYYIDWAFGLGVAFVDLEDNATAFVAGGEDFFENKSEVGLSLKTHVKWHLTDSFKLGLEFLNYYYHTAKPEAGFPEKWTRSYDFVFTVGMQF